MKDNTTPTVVRPQATNCGDIRQVMNFAASFATKLQARRWRPSTHAISKNNNHAPAERKAMPEARAIQRPNGKNFSKSMSNASSAIQSTFITPPTNKSTINTQQQPMQ